MQASRVAATLIAAACVTLTTAACQVEGAASSTAGTRPGPTAAASAATQAGSGSAARALEALPVKGRAPMTGYTREAFGSAWKDVNGNDCDTRNDILARDLTSLTWGSDRCTILSGVLDPDPYTATRIQFTRGASLIDIDHVVALGNAWVTGAFRWAAVKREAIANDPLNLLAVQASANRQKSDADAATWLPSNKAYRCAYVARQIAVKAKYGLWVTAPEKQAMQRVLSTCPGQALPKGGNPVPVATDPAPAPTTPGTGQAVRYGSCAEAKAAGVTPIRKADKPDLYAANTHLDGDKDGVACDS